MINFVSWRRRWVPGDVEVTIECLPGSSLPVEPQAQGYALSAAGEGERIVPTAIIERFCIGADGVLEPLTTGSIRPVVQTVSHANLQSAAVCLEHILNAVPRSVPIITLLAGICSLP